MGSTNDVERGFSPIEKLLRERAEQGGEGLIADGYHVPPESLLEGARALAARLVQDGIRRDDFIALRMRNSAEYLGCALAVMFAGAVLVPVNARLTAAEIAGLFAACRPRAWIADVESQAELREAEGSYAPDLRYVIDADPTQPLAELRGAGRPSSDGPIVPIAPTDTGTVFFTAGTTGQPKGALTSHQAIAAFADIVSAALGMTKQDRVILPMPMFYSGGLKASLANVLIGARVVVFRHWHAADLVDAMGEHDGTFLWAVPSVWAIMMKSNGFDAAKVQNVRVMWRGGSHTPRSLLDSLIDLFPGRPHYHSYGQTECNMVAMEHHAIEHPESVGVATPGSEISIEGHRRPETEGEIWLRGPQQFSGYLGSLSKGDRSTISDGWVHSGDRGWLAPDGRLHVIGRGSDIIIRGGENISSAEVERVILDLPNVAESAVVPVADDVFGQELKAIVVLKPATTLTEDDLRRACSRALAEFKVPRYIEFRTQELPKNAVGKIVKAGL